MLKRVSVSAPARLHFGLFSIGDIAQRQFGGVGLMIDRPRTRVVVSQASRFSIEAPCQELADAVRSATTSCFDTINADSKRNFESLELLPVNVELQSVPPRHSGFGSGTQIALATSAALFQLFQVEVPCPSELASIVGRGKKSAIGTHGFGRGGFLVDRGKAAGHSERQMIAPLDFQTNFPDQWRIVTIQLHETKGLSGREESSAFQTLPPTTEEFRLEMVEIVRSRMIPGVIQHDLDVFGEAAFEFGRRSGMMYKSVQNGPYNGSEVQMLVERIRDLGVKAVGQSSWGPCVFAIVGNHKEAVGLKNKLAKQYQDIARVEITRANNRGARIT